jgi:acyl-CoA reductase-like NAD-dependent aldehyde dehydrogenase
MPHAQVHNPSMSEVFAKVPHMKANETKAAIAAASAAWPAWCKKTAKERGAIMRKCAPPLALPSCAYINGMQSCPLELQHSHLVVQ